MSRAWLTCSAEALGIKTRPAHGAGMRAPLSVWGPALLRGALLLLLPWTPCKLPFRASVKDSVLRFCGSLGPSQVVLVW